MKSEKLLPLVERYYKLAVRGEPEGHSLYWVYAHFGKDYNFSTHESYEEALESAKEFMQPPYSSDTVYIFYGNKEEGAFTHLDPVDSFYKNSK